MFFEFLCVSCSACLWQWILHLQFFGETKFLGRWGNTLRDQWNLMCPSELSQVPVWWRCWDDCSGELEGFPPYLRLFHYNARCPSEGCMAVKHFQHCPDMSVAASSNFPTCPDVHVYDSDLYVCNLTGKPNVWEDVPEKLQDQETGWARRATGRWSQDFYTPLESHERDAILELKTQDVLWL